MHTLENGSDKGLLPRICGMDEAALWLPALGVLLLVSSHTGFNHHFRYVLPAVPFVYVWISRVAERVRWPPDGVTVWVGLLVAWTAVSSLAVYPHSLSYFNELVGGPAHGWRYLSHSNTDWGQDLGRLRRWAMAHPEARPLYVAPAVSFSPALEDWEHEPVPPDPRRLDPFPSLDVRPGPLPGWYAVSVNRLHAPEGALEYLKAVQPVGRIGYSLRLFHLTAEDVQRLRENRPGVNGPESPLSRPW